MHSRSFAVAAVPPQAVLPRWPPWPTRLTLCRTQVRPGETILSTSHINKSYISNMITCEYPLPDPEFQDYVFQTKAFDGLLDRYTITQDGRLILHAVAQEFVPPEERPNYGTPDWNSPWGPWEGAFRPVPAGDVEIPFWAAPRSSRGPRKQVSITTSPRNCFESNWRETNVRRNQP
jgi:hypothetical protein